MPPVLIKKAVVKNLRVDSDTVLTKEEKRLLEQSYENERKGLLISSAELRKKLGL